MASTRRPEAELEAGYRIRPARPEDLPALPEIERAAAQLFRQVPGDLLAGVQDDVTSGEDFEHARLGGWLLVAAAPDGTPVGFALMDPLPGSVHLDEIDVHPDHGRRGIGAALVRAVVAAAGDRGYPAVTLTTFREVPWNAPFYAGLGFRALEPDEWTPELASLVAAEAEAGLPAERRVVMRCEAPAAGGSAPQGAP